MKIGVIADDLTGGNGTGVKLTKLGYNTSTIINYNNLPHNLATNAVVIDTDSRYVKESVARKRITTVIENLLAWDVDIICKRIDSTIRGNIGIEIDTMLDILSEEAVVILTPTFPEAHRIVSGGYLLVKGQPVQLSDVSKDPLKPVLESYVPDVIQSQSKNKVTYIPLSVVLNGETELANMMEAHIAQGSKIIVVDSISDEDIETVAEAMNLIKDKLLIPADPGPLTAAYVRARGNKLKANKKIIITVGSVTSNSHEQLNYLYKKRSIQPISVNPSKLATKFKDWNLEVERVIALAKEYMKTGNIIVITTDTNDATILDLEEIAQEENVSAGYLAKRISDGLANISRVLVLESDFEIGGCFTSGGDVTASFCSVGLVDGIRLSDEILPLIAFGHFVGGYFDGIPIVTKGGTAGDLEAIYTCVKYLESNY